MTSRMMRCSPLCACTAAVLMLGLTACSSTENRTESMMTALTEIAQAESVFDGRNTRTEIKARLDEALTLYGLPTTADNYSRAASTLVVLRKANGTPEMTILARMIRSRVPGMKISFPEAAAMSSAHVWPADLLRCQCISPLFIYGGGFGPNTPSLTPTSIEGL